MLHPPNILKRNKVLVNKGLVDFRQDIQAFCDFPKDSMDSIKVVDIFAGGDEELSKRHVLHMLQGQCLTDNNSFMKLSFLSKMISFLKKTAYN